MSQTSDCSAVQRTAFGPLPRNLAWLRLQSAYGLLPPEPRQVPCQPNTRYPEKFPPNGKLQKERYTPPKAVIRGSPHLTNNRPGDEFNRRTDWATILEPHGWRPAGERNGVKHWTRPGKGFGTSATTNHAGTDLFYVFSSNAYPFQSECAYTRFVAHTVLNHEGDFAAAAKKLAANGYGKKNLGTYGVYGVRGGFSQASLNQAVNTYDVYGVPRRDFPELHEAARYGLAGEIVAALEPHTEAHPFALLSQLLAFFGNAIGRNAHWFAEATRHALILFVILVGETSRGRKGTSEEHIRRLFTSIDPDWVSDRVVSGLSSGEGLIWHVRDPVYKVESNEILRERKLVDAGIEDKRLLVVEHEFASVLKVLKREGNTLSPVIRNAWDRGALSTLTKKDPNKATDAHVSIVGHITQQELLTHFSEVEAANGFGNRFLWGCVRRSKELAEGGDLDELKRQVDPLIEPLQAAIRFSKNLHSPIYRDGATRENWKDLYSHLTRPYPGFFGAMTARAEAQVMRLASIYALLDQSMTVHDDHLGAAYAFWKYCEDSCRYIFGDSVGDPVADTIQAALRERPEGMTRSQIRSELFQRNKSAQDIDRALKLLETCGLIVVISEKTKGRPAERILHIDHSSGASE